MTTAPDHFTPEDLARLTAETFIDAVDFHDEIDSTNTRAAAVATGASPADRSTLLVLAERQIAGRGRGSNAWWSADGALTFSILLRDAGLALPKHRWPLVALTTGLAACRAIDQCLYYFYPHPQPPAPTTRVKWPNDVFVDNRKACGILVEAATGGRDSIIIGVGLNVNNSAAHCPPELRASATALCDIADREIPRIDVLILLLRELADGLKELTSGSTHWQGEFADRCLLTGRTVEVAEGSRQIVGVCGGIDDDGALLVTTESGPQRVLSGTVTRFG